MIFYKNFYHRKFSLSIFWIVLYRLLATAILKVYYRIFRANTELKRWILVHLILTLELFIVLARYVYSTFRSTPGILLMSVVPVCFILFTGHHTEPLA